MQDMTSQGWQRSGSSVVWSPALLGPLILGGDALPLRTVLRWMKVGFPDTPPGDRPTVLVGGLQAVLESFPPKAPEPAFGWLRHNIMPLVRAFQRHWDRVGLIFAMDGPDKLFTFNEADELVYFGRAKERSEQVKLTLGLWNGAATGQGAFQLLVPETKEVGGYHVKRVS
jgi:hypothetical protein